MRTAAAPRGAAASIIRELLLAGHPPRARYTPISRTNMAAQEVARLGERLGAREIGIRDAVVFKATTAAST